MTVDPRVVFNKIECGLVAHRSASASMAGSTKSETVLRIRKFGKIPANFPGFYLIPPRWSDHWHMHGFRYAIEHHNAFASGAGRTRLFDPSL